MRLWFRCAWVIPAFRLWTVWYAIAIVVLTAVARHYHQPQVYGFAVLLIVVASILYIGFSSIAHKRGKSVLALRRHSSQGHS